MEFLQNLFKSLGSIFGESRSIHIPKYLQNVDVAFWKPNSYRAEKGELVNLSVEGLRVASYWNIGRGASLELNLDFPVDFPSVPHSLRLQAKVVRCHKPYGRKRYRFECQFVDISQTAVDKINEFLEWGKKRG